MLVEASARGDCSVKKQFGFAFAKRRVKPRRLVNLSVAEVSSVTFGAAPGAKVLLRKREGNSEMQIDKHAPYGGLNHNEMAEREKAIDLNAAYRVSKLMSLDKLCKDHSAGKIDGALFSEGLRALANAERPGDKLAFAKYMADHKLEIAEKVRADTEAEQKRTALGDGYNLDMDTVWGCLTFAA